MPRKLRVEFPGAIYHVMSRANGTGDIFESDVDRQDFVKTLAEACEKTGFEVQAYCLMRNHFHLVVETPQGNLEEPQCQVTSLAKDSPNPEELVQTIV